MTGPQYRAFMLRLWQIKNGERVEWVFLVEDPHTGTNYRFDSPHALIEFLSHSTSPDIPPGDHRPDSATLT